MVNTRYANAFKEVDYYLKGIREEDIEKIPILIIINHLVKLLFQKKQKELLVLFV